MSDLISKREVLQILKSHGVLCDSAKELIENMHTVDLTNKECTEVSCSVLFQGQRLDNGEWIYGSLVPLDNGGKAIIPEEEAAFMPSGPVPCCICICHAVDPSTVTYRRERKNQVEKFK